MRESPNYGPPAFRRPHGSRRIGASPSGKAAYLDSAIRRFESSRPSHAFPEFGDFAMTGAEARIPWAFTGAEIGDRLEWVSRSPIGGRVSNLQLPISGVGPWAWPRPVSVPRGPVRNYLEDRPSRRLTPSGCIVRLGAGAEL